jgi:GTP-binding protein
MGHHAPHPAAAAQSGAHLSEPPATLAGPPEPGEDELEAGRRLFAAECRFMLGVVAADHLPPPAGPEIAFAGRSNVGKSSLINALTGRHSVARASGQPGRTRQLNFFDLGGRLTLVDMPGYGYAQAPKDIKADWQGLMFDYLRGRPTLRRVMLLLDARIEVKPTDIAVMELLDRAAVTFQIILTKTDGLKPPALLRKEAEAGQLARSHPAAYPLVSVTSSETGLGIPELRAELASLAVRTTG